MAKLSLLFTGVALALSTAVLADTVPLNLDNTDVTVSGLSSGGYMATQYHLANSDTVSGAAIIAAGPYYCAQNDITTALSQCVNKIDQPINLSALNQIARKWADNGDIPALSNLTDDRVWLLHGSLDKKVISEVTDLLHQQYAQWIKPENLSYISDKPFSHVFPTVDAGGDCMQSESPFIGQCDYDAAGELLSHLVPNLNPPDEELSGELITFDQHELGGDDADTLAQTGYAYVPQSCASGNACKVHISFHGCNQFADVVGTAYAEKTGLNRWADDNDMVVIYPQTKKSLFMPLNPQGCWDWWGYTGDNYATSQGKQIKAISAIIDGLNTAKKKEASE